MRVTILDYGAGNLHSLAKALDDGVSTVRVAEDPVPRWTETCLCFQASERSVTRPGGCAQRAARYAKRFAEGSRVSAFAWGCSCSSMKAKRETAPASA